MSCPDTGVSFLAAAQLEQGDLLPLASVASRLESAYLRGMPYYELKKLKRGFPPNADRPDIRPASDRGVGSELFEAKDDDEAAAIGRQHELRLGSDYIVTVSDVRDGARVMIYPRSDEDTNGG